MKKFDIKAEIYFRKKRRAIRGHRFASKKVVRYFLYCVLLCFFFVTGIHILSARSRYSRLSESVLESEGYRRQRINSEMLEYIREKENPGMELGLYWLENGFGQEIFRYPYTDETFLKLERVWSQKQGWEMYCSACEAVWNDLKYFPIPEPSNGVRAEVTFEDSWMFERNYGGKRGHEGTDIMASTNERGLYPVVSMTDGIILHKGWLEKGGYRLGITAPGGGYFYYAHLDSYADLEEGDAVKAGDLLGFMGDTGYSQIEGTTGNFPVHLHLGIYLVTDDQEISVNPYYPLRYLENRRIKCAYLFSTLTDTPTSP